MSDLISRKAVIDALMAEPLKWYDSSVWESARCHQWMMDMDVIKMLPSAQSEIIQCKDCKYWRQQTSYQGAPLSFGFCENEDMWRSLYGETTEIAHIETDDNHYCGFAERRTDE